MLTGQAGYRPIALLIAALFFAVVVLAPIPGSLTDLVDADAEVRGRPAGPHANPKTVDSSEQVARRAMVMLGILLVVAILWGTEGLPIGGTVILVAVLMLGFGILPANEIPKAFVNDAVFFILGILALAVGVTKTGLDKRIGLLLLSRISSTGAFAFALLPVLAVSSAFLSEHALVALLIPDDDGSLQGDLRVQRHQERQDAGRFPFSEHLLRGEQRGTRVPRRGQAHRFRRVDDVRDAAGTAAGLYRWGLHVHPL